MKRVDVLIFGSTVGESWLNKDLVELALKDKSIKYKVAYSKKQIVANIFDVYECVFRFVSPKVSLDNLTVKDFYLSSNLLKQGSKKEIEHCIHVGRSSYAKALDVINQAFEESQK